MLPIRDHNPASRFPRVTVMLIVINVVVFLFEVMLGERAQYLLMDFGIVPLRYTNPEAAKHLTLAGHAVPLLSSMFLHGGWIHLIGNMWTLWIFGDNVEDQLGHGKFILLYLIGGLVAGLLHIVTNANSDLPTIGASGAVAGIMGAYFRFFPHARIDTIIPPLFFVFELPAIFFLGWWFVLQFFNGTMTLLGGRGDFGGIAWWAHIGGFLFGLYIAGRFARKRRSTRYEYDRWE